MGVGQAARVRSERQELGIGELQWQLQNRGGHLTAAAVADIVMSLQDQRLPCKGEELRNRAATQVGFMRATVIVAHMREFSSEASNAGEHLVGPQAV